MPTLRQQAPRVKHERGSLGSGRGVLAVVAVAALVVVGLVLWGTKAPLVVVSIVVNLFSGY